MGRPPAGTRARRQWRRWLADGGVGCASATVLGAGCAGTGLVAVIGIFVALSSVTFTLGSCEPIDRPGGGRHSERLAVTVSPRTDLVDGTVAAVRSTAFEVGTVVGVTQCTALADTRGLGADACDTTNGARFAVPEGGLDVSYAIRRVITVDGRAVDCASRPKRCLVVAAATGDYDHSGGQSISFRGGLPSVPLTATTERRLSDRLPVTSYPSGPQPDGTEVLLVGRAFVPGEPIVAAWCTDDAETEGFLGSCEPVEPGGAAAVGLGDTDRVTLHADQQGTVATGIRIRAEVTAYDLADLLASASDHPVDRVVAREPVDCRERAGRCWFVLAAAADTQRSAIVPYEVTPA